MREYVLIALVSLAALGGIFSVTQSGPHGAFIGRPHVRIITDQSPVSQIVCADSTTRCVTPSCKTGLSRIALLENNVWRYQWVDVPDKIVEQRIGNCCAPGSTLTLYVDEAGETKLLDLTCTQGEWAGRL